MSNNRPRPQSQKGKASTPAATKKSASSQRFSERQAAKEQAAREARRARTRTYGIVTIALVVLVVAVLVIVKVAGGGGGSGSVVDVPSPPAGTPIPAATLAKLQSVPVSTLTAAPTDGILTTPQSIKNPALTADGKPELLYIGAEYCPHCAAERWPLYIALSKFGTFSPEPGRIHSANLEGNVPTLTFYGTTYTSPYFTFTPVEVYTNKPSGNGYAVLQAPTQAQLTLWTNTNGGEFPFVDFGGKEVLPSAQYSYAPLQNLPFSAVAAQVGNNSTTIGADIDASAAQLITTICDSVSHDQPSAVCSAVHRG
jgi:thiol-disulfide isomerase/thioredoxin